MTRTSLVSFIALTVGIGSALAAGVGLDSDLQGNATTLEKAEASIHAASVFSRADINRDNMLDADEYAALSIVTAELSYLNGYIAFEGVQSEKTVALPVAAPGVLTRAERTRIEAIARNEFYSHAGEDAALSADEYVQLSNERFEDADRNNNGTLAQSELLNFAASQTRIAYSGV